MTKRPPVHEPITSLPTQVRERLVRALAKLVVEHQRERVARGGGRAQRPT